MSDASDVVTNSKQLAPTSTWGKTPRQVAGDFDPDKSSWGGAAIHAAAVELRQKLPSRSIYRDSDKPIDTLAGFELNTDAAVHALFTERAAEYGDTAALATIQKAADGGTKRAQLFVSWIGSSSTPRSAPAVQRAAVGLTDNLPTSVADFFTPARRGWIHTVATLILAVLASFIHTGDGAFWSTWTPLVVGVVVAAFDLGVSLTHSRSGLRSAVYGLILAAQPIALVLHWVTDEQWTSVAALLAAVFGGVMAAAKTPKW